MSIQFTTVEKAPFFGRKNLVLTTFISIAYLLLSALLIGFKTDQVWLVAIFNVCFYLSWPTRRFILGFSIFIVYWILYDYMKAFPNYLFATVHIRDLYEAERHLFGIMVNGARLTPNEYWLLHTQPWLDVICGTFYLCWIPVPLLFAVYLFYKNRLGFLHFASTFLFVNLLGFVVYYVYPAAPPWYVQLHGFDFYAHTPGNTAGLARFDHHLGVTIFQSLYAKGSNVFAAMPSLHSAYPLIVLSYSWWYARGWMNVLFTIVTVGIWFTAVYTSHHYVLDVLAGIICATIGLFLYRRLLMKVPAYDRLISRYYRAVL